MRALVLSGGGANGAYQVGAINYLLGKRRQHFQVITGTSVGALNGAYLAMYPEGHETMAAHGLRRLWSKIEGNRSVYRDWPVWGKLAALWRSSVYSTEPLQALVRQHLDVSRVRASGKELRVVAVELHTGELTYWSEADDDLITGVLASCAFPVMFEPIPSGFALYTDGGVREVAPLRAAIKLGATEIVVVTPDPADPPAAAAEKWTALTVAKRSLELLMDEVVDNDLARARRANTFTDTLATLQQAAPHGYKSLDIQIVRPRASFGDSLDFSPDRLTHLIEEGHRDAEYVFCGRR